MGIFDYLMDFLKNKVLMAALVSWLVSQVAKLVIYSVAHKEFTIERLVGDGGMPSAHSACVSALAVACAYEYGLGSAFFAISFILAVIVMHDASGVRLETGKHSSALNDILDFMEEFGKKREGVSSEERFKELVGHTHFQVVIGSVLGSIVSAIYCYIV